MHTWYESQGYTISASGEILGKSGRPLKPYLAGQYLAVKLKTERGKWANVYVHQLVASKFCERRGTEVNHIDGDKYNNRASNLEWCLRSHNNLLMQNGNSYAAVEVYLSVARECFERECTIAETARLVGKAESTISRLFKRWRNG